ncbi:aminotransferase class I/II-fold pyridoxal phosphate-dependent enzyme [Streptomyces sp. NBC_01571]|uniref:aminotransferase class I/II-fold pyridoxal phosphate-dependent enzyme n=1 Tax=Streptomyces sp. NBC_01571 TaxID=2975883 RepID=UPI0022532039|nr:aminotransferase class I/II-fold pyridoxal phosphate-dependent enzyme [Streptomyces sp. NBC_01571]MCX4576061.1 aminotransferase class I/II-fold pyridoxal phosphate-dependent enzyme [Streptomyces sp. NBC_01571]
MDILEKCRPWTAEHLRATGRDCYFRAIGDTFDGTEADFEGRRVIVAASHDYLGLSAEPRVREAAVAAVRRFGTSLGGSRAVSGSLELHEELENDLAAFLGHEAAAVLPSGYQANLMLAPLLGDGDTVFSDFSNHVSLEEAVRLGRANERKFLHGNLDHLEELLSTADGIGNGNGGAGTRGDGSGTGGKLILTDGVFSVDGDVCDLPGLMKLADAHGARVVVDSSHDLGVLGPTGAGAGEHFGLRPDLVTSALSKSLASVGGVIAGPADVIRYLRFHARTALFTAAASPANVAAALAALRLLRAEPERRVRVLDLAERLHNGLRALGFDTGASVTPVVPVLVPGREQCMRMWRELFEAGVFAAPMVHPVVRTGREVLRITLTAAHTDDQLARVLAAFEHVGRVEGVIPGSAPASHTPVRIARPRGPRTLTATHDGRPLGAGVRRPTP